MATHMTPKTPRNVAGFTLIDSMIAVVVLATGILALTLLQVSMLRSAAEARERSVAMTVAQNLLESQRALGAQTQTGYQNLANSGVFASGACDYATSTVVPNTTGLTTAYRYCVTVQRFRASGSTFASVPVSGAGAPVYSGLTSEYKQITVDVGWRKNDGSWGTLRLGDALSGIPLINSNDLNNRSISGGAGQVNNVSGAIQNTDANAVGAINRSIATLADDPPVFYQNPSSTLWFVQDLQPFHYVGGTLPSVKFRVTVAGLSAFFSTGSGNTSAPYIGWTNATTQGDCVRDGTTTTFVCDLYSAANATGVNLKMYNYYQNHTARNNAATCGSGQTQVKADLPRCNVYRLSTVTPGITFTPPAFRTSSTPGLPKDDEQVVSLGNVVDGAAYTVTFAASTSNPVEAVATCDALTGQPQLSFLTTECRR